MEFRILEKGSATILQLRVLLEDIFDGFDIGDTVMSQFIACISS